MRNIAELRDAYKYIQDYFKIQRNMTVDTVLLFIINRTEFRLVSHRIKLLIPSECICISSWTIFGLFNKNHKSTSLCIRVDSSRETK